ncbi:DNA glycosylase [Lineolata rhizophorae]|uniref:DNA glycosylase n=1 Tax=Lineolata rhizophorae TaxID=578093 RepID=A0A6A6P476_9PEZI|nr:DNA glycosylase [Lineolata rhizophorae]
MKSSVIDGDELPHNLGKLPSVGANVSNDVSTPPAKKRKTRTSAIEVSGSEAIKDEKTLADVVAEEKLAISASSKGTQKLKDSGYGLKPGQTPYPEWPHPSPEECLEVCKLLAGIHGEVSKPEAIPPPSLTVTGCGEVPSVLDALVRTKLSAATTSANSSRAFQGLVQRFGILQEGIGKGSVDWDAVRRADVKDIFKAIESGGLANVKSKEIKAILQMVYEENQARRKELLATTDVEGEDKSTLDPGKLTSEAIEVRRAESNVLSLDHLHTLPSDDAFKALTKYPGIGAKTASCVLLFCLQRPSFAVDTHVFRLCKWLGWVPPDRATRNTAYAHCEVRVPDDLKYPLHQLLIKHGRQCPRCRASTGETSKNWSDGCVLEHLMKRSGTRKGGANTVKSTKFAGRKRGAKEMEDDDADDTKSALSSAGSGLDTDDEEV